jgi:hypothetical protein
MSTPLPSCYFTLFKKLQVLGHVPKRSDHGQPGGEAGYDLNNPDYAFLTSNHGTLLGANPQTSPPWAVLNAKAQNKLTKPPIGGVSWPTMPLWPVQSWTDFS